MWMANFFYTSVSGKYKINSQNAFEIAVKSRELYFQIAEDENPDKPEEVEGEVVQ